MDTSEDLVTNVATCSINWLATFKSKMGVLNLPALFVQKKAETNGLLRIPIVSHDCYL